MNSGYQTGVIVSCLLFVFPIMTLLGTIPPNIIKIITDDSAASGGGPQEMFIQYLPPEAYSPRYWLGFM